MSASRTKAEEAVASLAKEPDGTLSAPDTVTREEAQKMANDAATLAVQSVMDKIAAAGSNSDLKAFAEHLAKSIAEVGNQGTGKQVIDPAILTRRTKAREKMVELLTNAAKMGVKPIYRLTGIVHLGDQMIKPIWIDSQRVERQTTIRWSGVPNEAMVPASAESEEDRPGAEAAKTIFECFCESIGKAPGTVARIMPIGNRGNMATPGGNVIETLTPIPAGYMGGDLEVEPGALPPRDTPANGLEVVGGAASGHQRKTVAIPILGTITRPAIQQVA